MVRGHERAYLSVFAMYRDHAEYLAEWIEFHRVVGVERFFLYNNQSEDDHREVLAPYVDAGIVVPNDWPRPFFPLKDGLVGAYRDCLARYAEASRWIAFIDIDEFLFSPTGEPVSEILRKYESAPGVVVNWCVFGTSGHRTKPPGLVVENYLRRTTYARSNSHIKSIVDPTRALDSGNPHFFLYEDGFAVNENHRPIEKRGGLTDEISFSRLRINHYWSKSEEECRRKLEQWENAGGEAAGAPRPWSYFEMRDKIFNEELDETILMYLPRLREALGAAKARG